MSTIVVTVNGVQHTLAKPVTLEELLNTLHSPGSHQSPVASAVNGLHVARQARGSLVLNDKDAVTTFEPITGG